MEASSFCAQRRVVSRHSFGVLRGNAPYLFGCRFRSFMLSSQRADDGVPLLLDTLHCLLNLLVGLTPLLCCRDPTTRSSTRQAATYPMCHLVPLSSHTAPMRLQVRLGLGRSVFSSGLGGVLRGRHLLLTLVQLAHS